MPRSRHPYLAPCLAQLLFKLDIKISDITLELDEYLKGGQDNEHKQLREGYGHIPKPQARKIKEYLYGILEDAWRYSHDRRPGRRKKQSK